MLSRWLLDFYKGYIVVTISGNRIPLLLNMIMQQGLWIHDILYRKNGSIQFTMLRSDVRHLRPLLKQTHSKIHFGKRTGLPFFMQRAWKRKSFLAGLLIFMGLLYSLTSVVWTIEVEGTKNLSPETIVTAADSVGIHKGAWIGRLPDTDLLQAEMLDKVPELSWVGVRIQGTKVNIQVVEKVPPAVHTPNSPQNIVASKKAIIDKVLVEKGLAAVQKGQLVNPGDVLISGTLPNGNTVQGKGKVEATVWYGSEMQIPLQHLRKQYTGPSYNKHYLVFGSYPVQVWGYGQNPYKSFEEQAADREFYIGSFTLPIRFRTAEVKETQEDIITLSEEEAKQEALERAAADVSAKIGESGRVIDQKILHQRSEHGNLYIKVLTIVQEDIGKPQPF